MKTYVIGDTHGCYDEFEKLMEKLNIDLKKDKLVMLGDYIDRGDKSWEMVNGIMALQKMFGPDQIILLKGNHEQMAIDYELHKKSAWLYNGASSTIESFRKNRDSIANYIDFLLSLPLYHEDENFIYVHGGIKRDVILSRQNESDLLWLRDEFFRFPNSTGKTVVFGHTPTLSIGKEGFPVWLHNNLALDTGCVFGGALSAIEIENGKVLRIYQQESRKAS